MFVFVTLWEIKQNQSEFVSHTLLEYLSVVLCCVSSHARPTEQVSVPQKSGVNPVHLCPYEAKEFLPGLILLVVFSPFLNNSSISLAFPSYFPPSSFHFSPSHPGLALLPVFLFWSSNSCFHFFSFCREQHLFCSAGLTMRSMWRLDALDPLTTSVSSSWLMKPFSLTSLATHTRIYCAKQYLVSYYACYLELDILIDKEKHKNQQLPLLVAFIWLIMRHCKQHLSRVGLKQKNIKKVQRRKANQSYIYTDISANKAPVKVNWA